MGEFDKPRSRREKRRVQDVHLVLGSFEHEQSLRRNMNAIDACEGNTDRWYEARERLYDFQARYGHPVISSLTEVQVDDTGESNG
mgnify:CR=1 FL=1